jgi:hypothetical protein
MKVILAGGPMHGKRLDDVRGSQFVTAVESPIPLWATVSTRPRFWADPVGWFRWKPSTSIDAADAVPAVTQHLYRVAGFLDDDTRVYWYQGPYAGEPPHDPADVLRAVWTVMYDHKRDHPFDGPGLRWEMGPEWHAAVRRASIGSPGPPEPGDVLAGYPVRVTTGSPRLVTEDTP